MRLRLPPFSCRAALPGVVALAWFCAVGCETEYRVVGNPWGIYSRMADPKRSVDKDPFFSGNQAPQEGWAILLESFTGAESDTLANRKLFRLQRELHIEDAWRRDEPGRIVIYRGRFDQPSSMAVQESLRQTRMLQIDGLRPYAHSEIIPLASDARNAKGPWDLHGYPGLYTLQIAAYTPEFGDKYRDAAEKAVQTLRDEGVQAYYFHGPETSIVCVGLFHEWDFSPVKLENGSEIMGYPRAVLELQKKEDFSYNLVNGRKLMVREPGQSQPRAQPSSLVKVPD